jgi:hypothetical protein
VRPRAVVLASLLAPACASLGGLTSDGTGGGGGSDSDGGAGVGSTTGCAAGFTSCPPHPVGSCETFTAGDVANCGGCGTLCGARNVKSPPTCNGGRCALDCAVGFGNCNGLAADGCEHDLSNDPKNCGACGRDCGRGGCAAGACTPEVLAPADACATCTIFVDDTAVYFHFLGNVVSCPKAGCAAPTTLMTGLYEPAVAFDGATLFEADAFGKVVRACPKNGCSGAPATVATTTGVTAIAVDASTLYYVDSVTSAGGLSTTYAIYACPKTGCNGSPRLLTSKPGANLTRSLEIAGSTLLWSANEGVRACALPACASVATLAPSTDGYPPNVASDGVGTFFFEPSTSEASSSCPVAGCGGSPTPFATAASGIQGLPLGFDGTTLYVAAATAIARCTEGACASPTPVPDVSNVSGRLAFDAAAVYWVSGTNVVRVPK